MLDGTNFVTKYCITTTRHNSFESLVNPENRPVLPADVCEGGILSWK